MIKHRDPDTDPTRQRQWPWYTILLILAFIFVAAAGSAAVIIAQPDNASTRLTTSLPSPTPSETASRTPVPVDSTTVAPNSVPPVPSKCWSARPLAEDLDCQNAIKNKTKFVPRYMTNQKSLAATHPVVRITATGRGANSLARHGLLTCWLISEPKYSLDDVRSAFYLWFHRHQFTVPNDDTDAAADNVIFIAVQEVCPSVAPALERKGGPKAEIVGGH